MSHNTWQRLFTLAMLVGLFCCIATASANAAPLSTTTKPFTPHSEIQASDALSTTHLPLLTQPFPEKVTELALGYQHLCAITETGSVYCWGNILETGGDFTGDFPVRVNGLTAGARTISSFEKVTCALLLDNSVQCWGVGENPQPLVNVAFTRYPTAITGWAGEIHSIAVGRSHLCVRLATGAVQCAGFNSRAQLGDGTTEFREGVVNVVGLGGNVVAIAAGADRTCAYLESGELKCWGSYWDNADPQDPDSGHLQPTLVQGFSGRLIAFDVNYAQSCAVLEDGSVWCWNDNLVASEVSGFVAEVVDVTVSDFHACARLANGHVQCWGSNERGELGNGTTTPSATPVLVAGIDRANQIAVGVNTSCALLAGGVAKCWGRNVFTREGVTKLWQVTPTQVVNLDQDVLAIATDNSISSDHHTCAIMADRTVKCWGYNSVGQLGDGTTSHRLAPVAVEGLSGPVQAIALGAQHSCAILAAGSVECWGRNDYGQLGDGTTITRTLPVPVQGLTDTVASLALGEYHSCAHLSSGGVQCWGGNEVAQLGDGTLTNRPTPAFVSGQESGVEQITATYINTCALLEGGTVRCWGQYFSYDFNVGQGKPVTVTGFADTVVGIDPKIAYLEDGRVQTFWRTMNGDQPPPLPETLTGFSGPVDKVSGQCALLTNHSVQCWGFLVGDGSVVAHPNPTSVPILGTSVEDIATSDRHKCALRRGGLVQCWGDAELVGDGRGIVTYSTVPRYISWLPPFSN